MYPWSKVFEQGLVLIFHLVGIGSKRAWIRRGWILLKVPSIRWVLHSWHYGAFNAMIVETIPFNSIEEWMGLHSASTARNMP